MRENISENVGWVIAGVIITAVVVSIAFVGALLINTNTRTRNNMIDAGMQMCRVSEPGGYTVTLWQHPPCQE